MQEIIIATQNDGKLKEIQQSLRGMPLILRSVSDFPGLTFATEDGKSFEENALKKAQHVASQLGKYVLADDSGLEVMALDGRPGIHSARFASPNARAEDNNHLLLKEMTNIPRDGRQARFVCVIAVVDSTGRSLLAEGNCEGEILEQPRGHGGFGYDPLFYVPEQGKTFAEMAPTKKDALSHRGRALAELRRKLPDFMRK